MARLVLSKMVNAPPAAVFAYVDAHENYHWIFRAAWPEWTTPRHQVGTRLKMDVRMAGRTVRVVFETTEVVPNSKIAGIYESGMKGSWEWHFEPVGEATNVIFVTDYQLPLGILGRIADKALVARGMRDDLEWALDHIKKHVEMTMRAA